MENKLPNDIKTFLSELAEISWGNSEDTWALEGLIEDSKSLCDKYDIQYAVEHYDVDDLLAAEPHVVIEMVELSDGRKITEAAWVKEKDG